MKFNVRRTKVDQCTPFITDYMEVKGMLVFANGSTMEGKIVYNKMRPTYYDDTGKVRQDVTWFNKDTNQ